MSYLSNPWSRHLALVWLCFVGYNYNCHFWATSQNSKSVADGSVIVALYTWTKSLAPKPGNYQVQLTIFRANIVSFYSNTEEDLQYSWCHACCSHIIDHPALLLQTIVIILGHIYDALLDINVDNVFGASIHRWTVAMQPLYNHFRNCWSHFFGVAASLWFLLHIGNGHKLLTPINMPRGLTWKMQIYTDRETGINQHKTYRVCGYSGSGHTWYCSHFSRAQH